MAAETPTQHARWRIWLVTDVYPPGCGGSGWSTHALARALSDRGHRVDVISTNPNHSSDGERRYDGIAVTEVGLRSARRDPRRRLGTYDYSYRALTRYLNGRLRLEPDVDVLHAQHMHTGPPSIHVGRQHQRATLVTVRDYWPVCLHGTSWWGGRDCRGCSTPNMTSCMQEYWQWPQPVARLMVAWARRRLRARGVALSDAHAVLAVSQAVRRRLERDLPDAPLSVVPNMVDPAVVQAAAASAPDSDIAPPYLLTAGKLEPTKGFDLLLQALGEIGERPTLVVAGEGSMRHALEEQAVALRLPVRFLGWVAHDQLLRLQQRAHAVVLPSAWAEPLSRIVLETMALGVPVVAWARGGNPEMIEPGVSGWLVDRPSDLAEAMRQLGSDERRREVGRAAQARVTTCYSPDVVYPAVASAYEQALVKAGRR